MEASTWISTPFWLVKNFIWQLDGDCRVCPDRYGQLSDLVSKLKGDTFAVYDADLLNYLWGETSLLDEWIRLDVL